MPAWRPWRPACRYEWVAGRARHRHPASARPGRRQGATSCQAVPGVASAGSDTNVDAGSYAVRVDPVTLEDNAAFFPVRLQVGALRCLPVLPFVLPGCDVDDIFTTAATVQILAHTITPAAAARPALLRAALRGAANGRLQRRLFWPPRHAAGHSGVTGLHRLHLRQAQRRHRRAVLEAGDATGHVACSAQIQALLPPVELTP
jgi:hypothetical protein